MSLLPSRRHTLLFAALCHVTRVAALCALIAADATLRAPASAPCLLRCVVSMSRYATMLLLLLRRDAAAYIRYAQRRHAIMPPDRFRRQLRQRASAHAHDA